MDLDARPRVEALAQLVRARRRQRLADHPLVVVAELVEQPQRALDGWLRTGIRRRRLELSPLARESPARLQLLGWKQLALDIVEHGARRQLVGTCGVPGGTDIDVTHVAARTIEQLGKDSLEDGLFGA